MKYVWQVFNYIRIGFLHAKYHRCVKAAEKARVAKDIEKFKKYIYTAEDAWKQIIKLKYKE